MEAETAITEVTRQGLGDPALVRKPYPVLEDASFFRTSRTLAELGRAFLKFGQALRKDVGVWSVQAARKVSAPDGMRRLRELGSTAKVRAAALMERYAAALSPSERRHAQIADKGLGRGNQRRWRNVVLGATASAVAVLLVLMVVLAWALSDVPWEEIAEGSLKPVVVLETAEGKPLVRQGPIQGPYAAYKDFPPHLVDAVLNTEDRRFYAHGGIDLKGISRALYRNVGAGEVVQGGSTITQQLIKILYLEPERTWKRKIQEAVIALWLEQKLGKDEILTRYLNSIYLGSGATGVPAAARIYFDKEVGDLNLGEAAMLAGAIRAPSQLNPLTDPEAARRRAQHVLEEMVKAGKISAAQASTARLDFGQIHPTKQAARSGSWFADWVMQEARELAGPYRGTIKIKTTMVPQLQVIAEKVVAEGLAREGTQAGATQAALVAMTPQGAVVAMVGGRDYGKSSFNRAATAMRQPGSAFKLFVYYAALKAGLTPFDRVVDGPIKIDGWSPENYSGGYRGRVSLAEAFARSLNGATVALGMKVGIGNVVAAARELGIDAALTETPSLALGASEVNLMDLTGAYASVRAGAAPIEPWGIASFHADGQPRAFRVGPPKQPKTDIRPFQQDLVGLLRLVVKRGTGREADFGEFAAGKTGTSQNYRDAWFIGFTEPLVVGVWVGNDDETPMRQVSGGKLPARIWRNFMTAALATSHPSDTAVGSTATSNHAENDAATACNFRVCSQAYRSFRPSDCTYQPYRGRRRLCEK